MALENYVKFLRGTPKAYEALTSKDKDTLYFISEKNSEYGSLYLGSKLIAGSGQPETMTFDSLKDITLSELGIEDGSLLVYDAEHEVWVDKPLDEVLAEIMTEMNEMTKAQVFEVSPNENESHLDAIARVVGLATLKDGDIAIVKELIAGEKYQHTAYVYADSWKAMDGNYNAESVYFDEDLLTTAAVGVITLENGQATIPAAGKNLKEVFNTIFVKEENPTTTQPSVTVQLNEAGSYEVGKTVNVNYTVTFEDGSYSYGPEPTGVTAKSYSVTDGVSTKTTSAGAFDSVLVTDNTNYRLTATVPHTAGNIPVTNTGNPYEAGQIAEGSANGNSSYIKGYRSFFYGMSAVDKDSMVYDSAFIRGLTNGKAYDAKKTLKFTASALEGVKRFVIAIPSASITSVRTGIQSATITSSMNADALEFYKELETTVAVQGADGHTVTVPYRVWVYEPTSIAAEEVHEVVLK